MKMWKGEIQMEYKRKGGFSVLTGIIATVITLMSLAIALLVILDRKKKKEEKELDDYLEESIN